MKVRYLGTGTVGIDGTGEVSVGGVINLPDEKAEQLLAENPQLWEAVAVPASTQVKGGRSSRRDDAASSGGE